MRSTKTAVSEPQIREPRLELFNCRSGTGNNAGSEFVNYGDTQLVVQQSSDIRFRHGNGHHRSARQLLHQPAPLGD